MFHIYFRKICKHCRCGPEDHDLTDDDDRDKHPINQPQENHYDNVCDLSSRLHKLNIDDPAVQSEIVTPENDIIIHRIIAENLVSTASEHNYTGRCSSSVC